VSSIPTIKASFELDEDGSPVYVKGDDDLKHYNIRLHVDNVPIDTYAVTYILHDSYYNPVREALDVSENFAEEIKSYGDYTVQAKIRSKTGVATVATQLSAALQAGHNDSSSSQIQSALNEIRAL
jgi:hypothetical protein